MNENSVVPCNNIDQFIQVMNDRVVTTSIDISNIFGKMHKNVLRDIEKLCTELDNPSSYFIAGENKDSLGRTQPMYFMNKDGFSLLVMGYNTTKALNFKVMFLKAFNKATKKYLESTGKMTTAAVSVTEQLAVMQKMLDVLKSQDARIKAIEDKNAKKEQQDKKVEQLTLFAPSAANWRAEITALIRKSAFGMEEGAYEENIKSLYNQVYTLLEQRLHISLHRRLTNRKKRAAEHGVAKSVYDAYTYIDIIEDDAKLSVPFTAIVKEVIEKKTSGEAA